MPNLFQNYSELISHGQKQVRQDVLKCLDVGIPASDPGHGTRGLVRLWLEEEYPAIRKEAKKEKARIYWGDEMGLRSDHATGRSYARRGQTPVIPDTGARFGCNMISAITNRGKLNLMVFKERFEAEVFKWGRQRRPSIVVNCFKEKYIQYAAQ